MSEASHCSDWGEFVALPHWDFAPEPLYQYCAPCWISRDGRFSLFLSHLSSHSTPGCGHASCFPIISLKQPSFLKCMYVIYLVASLPGSGVGDPIHPSFLKDWYRGREPTALTNPVETRNSHAPSVCSCCFIISIPRDIQFLGREWRCLVWLPMHHGPRGPGSENE